MLLAVSNGVRELGAKITLTLQVCIPPNREVKIAASADT